MHSNNKVCLCQPVSDTVCWYFGEIEMKADAALYCVRCRQKS